MRNWHLLAVVAFLPLMYGCSADARKPTALEMRQFSERRVIAIRGENCTGNPSCDGAVAGLEGALRQALLDNGYKVVDRDALAAVDKERMLREAGITDAQAGKLAQLAGADAILMARVTRVDGGAATVEGGILRFGMRQSTGDWVDTYEARARVEARLLDLSANVLWHTSVDAKETVGAPGDIGHVCERAAEEAVTMIPPKAAASETAESTDQEKS